MISRGICGIDFKNKSEFTMLKLQNEVSILKRILFRI